MNIRDSCDLYVAFHRGRWQNKVTAFELPAYVLFFQIPFSLIAFDYCSSGRVREDSI